jgi:sugar phosphate isomerase/epimerase
MTVSRRQFVTGTAVATLGLATRASFANPFGLPLGIQLYSVRKEMAENFDGALAGVAEAGFTEVEAAALPKKPAKEIRASLDKAGLRCVSAHHPFRDLHANFEETVAYDKELGCQFLICSSPSFRTPPPAGSHPAMALDDWHYMAEQFNVMGEKTLASGVHFGYHNHTPEFAATEGKTPLLELIRLTDAKNVTFELDCGWVIVGGANPIDLLVTHPHRFSMLHVKDFIVDPHAPKGTEPKVTELGLGGIDYAPIFAQAAKTQHIVHAFVEQEAFTMPWKQSLKLDADYMKKFKG